MGVRSGLYGDGWWRDNLRMTKDTFDILCNQLRPHLKKEKISQALPPLFFRAGSKVIRVLIARKEGEPGNEANHWLHFALTSHMTYEHVLSVPSLARQTCGYLHSKWCKLMSRDLVKWWINTLLTTLHNM